MGPGQKFLIRVGSAVYGLGLNLVIAPKNINFFNFFPSGHKKSLRIGLSFTAGQK